MDQVKYWIAIKKDGTEALMQTFGSKSELYNADGTKAKQIDEQAAKEWKSRAKKSNKRKKI